MHAITTATAIVLRWILMLMVFAMTLVILGQVIWRYVLETPFVWSEELSLLLMTWMTFLGSALLMMRYEHLAIDVFVDTLSPRWRHAANILGRALIFAFCLCLIYGAWILVGKTYKSITPGLQISVAWQYGGALVGGVLMAMVSLEQLINTLLGRSEGADSQ